MSTPTTDTFTRALRSGAIVVLSLSAWGCITPAGPSSSTGGSIRAEPVTLPAPPSSSERAEASARAPTETQTPGQAAPSSAGGSSAPAGAAGMPAASLALLEQSRSERAAGSLSAAAASIERALRIDPNNAELWLELAEIKLDEGDSAQAETMAQKAMTLAGGNGRLEAWAERLIAAARGL